MSARQVRVAAIQMEASLADIESNVAQACDLVDRAARAGAKYIALPEFFTTSIAVDDRLHRCALPRDNFAVRALVKLARSHGAVIGGSYLEFDEGHVFNSYTLIQPDGTVRRHRKDRPTMAEAAYYIGGVDRGLFRTDDAMIGVAVCWETIRGATVARLAGACDLVMSGSHWWSAPEWRFLATYWRYQAKLNASLMYRTPGRFARLVGAPLLHGSHCGALAGQYAITPGFRIPMRTHLVGEAQIVDASGVIVARRTKEEGAGHISADIQLARTRAAPLSSYPFWLERLPVIMRLMWTTQNYVCRKIYDRAVRAGSVVPMADIVEQNSKPRSLVNG